MNPSAIPPDILEALRKGNKIEAIKLLRAKTKAGLAEAKGVIEAMERHVAQPKPQHHAPSHSDDHPRVPHAPAASPITVLPGLSPGEQPRSSGATGFLVLIALAVIAWLFWKFG